MFGRPCHCLLALLLICSPQSDRIVFGSYFAFDHVHTPQFGAPPDGSEPSPRGPFGDALLQTDAAVGVVLQELRQAPHRGRTLSLLTSDNGAPSGGTAISGLNAPFIGTKFQTWEGGVRM